MPFDSNGNHSLTSGYEAENGQTIQPSQHNTPLEDISSSLSGTLLRSGVAAMTGAFKAAEGTVALPGIAFNTQTGTGFYKTASGFAVAISGVKVAEFAAGGLVLGGTPIGAVSAFAGPTAPAGWLFCYGQEVSRTTYAALYAVLGNTYGAVGANFNLPDLRGNTPVGKTNMGGSTRTNITSTYYGSDPTALGSQGGGQSVTMQTSYLPPYTPSGSVVTTSTLQFQTGGSPGGAPFMFITGLNNSANGSVSAASGLTSASTFTGTAQGGTSTPFSRVQPGIILNYIIFAGV